MEDIAALKVDERGYVADEARDRCFRQIHAQADNAVCIDCNARGPTWISLTYAVHLCLNCSGRHRQFGSHISFVRSADMDKFTREQLIRIAKGGNARAKDFFRKNGLARQPYDYTSPIAQRYPAMLDAELGATQTHAYGQTQTAQQTQKKDEFDLLDFGDAAASQAAVQESVPAANAFTFGAPLAETRAQQQTCTGTKSMMLGRGAADAVRGAPMRAGATASQRTGFSTRVDVDFDEFEKSIMSEAAAKKNTIATANGPREFDANTQTAAMSFAAAQTTATTNMAAPTYKPPAPQKIPDMSQFAGKTGISSDEVFGRGAYGNRPQVNVVLNPNKTSLSSDEYFGRAPARPRSTSNDTFEERAVQNIREGIATALKEGNKLVGMAKQWLNNHQL